MTDCAGAKCRVTTKDFNEDQAPVVFPRKCGMIPVGNQKGNMKRKSDVRQGTLGLMVLKTLDVLGPLHGYGIARRIEQISGDLLAVNQGTLYPVLLKLEQEGAIASEWGASENNRRARFYRLTRAGHKLLEAETRDWEQTAAIIARFLRVVVNPAAVLSTRNTRQTKIRRYEAGMSRFGRSRSVMVRCYGTRN
jgi:transcriptional regulator